MAHNNFLNMFYLYLIKKIFLYKLANNHFFAGFKHNNICILIEFTTVFFSIGLFLLFKKKLKCITQIK